MKKILDFFNEHKTIDFITRLIFLFCLYTILIPFLTDLINNIYVLFFIILCIFIIPQMIIYIYDKDILKRKKIIRDNVIVLLFTVIFALWFSYTNYGNFDGTNYYYPAQIVMEYEKRDYKKGSEQDKLCSLSDEMFAGSFKNNGSFDDKYKDIISKEDFKKLDIGTVMDKKQRGFFNRNKKLKDTYEKMKPILTLYDDKYAVVWVGTDTYIIENEKTVNYYGSEYRQIKYKKIDGKYKVTSVRDEKESYKENKMIHKRLKDMGRIKKSGYYDDLLDDEAFDDGYSEHLDYILKYGSIDTNDKDIIKIKDDVYKLAKNSYYKDYDETIKTKIDKKLYDKLSSKKDIKEAIEEIKANNEGMDNLEFNNVELNALHPIMTKLDSEGMTLWIKESILISTDISHDDEFFYTDDTSSMGIDTIYQLKIKITEKKKHQYKIVSVKKDFEAEKEINFQYNELKNKK